MKTDSQIIKVTVDPDGDTKEIECVPADFARQLEIDLQGALANIETYQEQLAATEASARNLMHYAKGLPGHVVVSGYDVSTRNEMLKVHEDKRDIETKWEELTKALGAHGAESDPLLGSDTNDTIHARAMENIRMMVSNEF